ncbi:hypothetical protein CDAR_300131 [Caerostris darwini]|uniref:Uncharacterized protein n=1 Tax=Caerostris darwini TaxID=1538125 RepID=A0AAV4W5E0_9ARAC|nr:hypothetical protein CDAR_300131 [Caerostris darwini]
MEIPSAMYCSNFVKILETISVKNLSINIQSVGSKKGRLSRPLNMKGAAGITYIRESASSQENRLPREVSTLSAKSFLHFGPRVPRRLRIRCVCLSSPVVFYPRIGII